LAYGVGFEGDYGSLMRHSVVLEPLVDSLIHGLLLVADHPYREALAAPAAPGRPAAVRDAMGIIEARAHLPLTSSTLARHCHVSVRTLQAGFQRHLGMSPMAYVRWSDSAMRIGICARQIPATTPSPPSRSAGDSPTSATSPPRTKRCTAKPRSKCCALHTEHPHGNGTPNANRYSNNAN
jgi:hypothetical protein